MKAVNWNRRYLRTSDLNCSGSCLFRALEPVDCIACVPVISMLIKCGTSCKEDNLCLCIAKEIST